MNTKPHLGFSVDTQTCEGQAREWFVRLKGDAVSAEDIAEWEAWLRADPAHGAAYDRVTEAWSLAAAVAVDMASSAEIARDTYDGSVPVAQWRPRPARARVVWSMAGLAVAASVAAALWFGAPVPDILETQQIATARAQHKDAVLSDGSKVALGGMTTLDVAFGRDRRTIVLQAGEALFRVAHERSRPFVVETAFGDITAVGTAFDVNVGAATVVLSVSEGVVSYDPGAALVKAGRKPMKIAAGQRLVIDANDARVARIDAGVPPSWTEGRLEYRNQALELVLDDVNRYSDQPIRIADPSLRGLAYTGTVRLTGITPWALGLGDAFPLVAEKAQDGAIVLKRKISSP